MSNAIPMGPNFALEEEANRLLSESRRGVTKLSDKTDFLTDEQLALRHSREVYNQNGTPDKGIVSGLYKRAYNPLRGKRPTSGLMASDSQDGCSDYRQEEWW